MGAQSAGHARVRVRVGVSEQQGDHTHAGWRRWLAQLAAAAMVSACSLAAAQTAVPVQPPNLAGALAGSLPGEASANGSATYTVPIPVPPGTAGVVPSLSLQYASHVGMGLLGRGWSIGGLSTITRCGKTIVQDGVARGIALTAEDRFCLDGQRLLLKSGTHGAAAEYRTEIDGFSRIVSFGSDPAKGPDRWEVWTKSGMVLHLGGAADATVEAQGKSVVLSWALHRARDRRNSYYEVEYAEDNSTGEHYPQRIRYTGNTSTNLEPYHAVNFVYETRPDLVAGYVAGSRLSLSKRLTAVRTHINTAADGTGGTLVRDIRVAYTTSPSSGHSLVDTLTDCDAAGTCLPATRFTWNTHDPAANTFAASGSGAWGGPPVVFRHTSQFGSKYRQVRNQITMGDFDGDGATDLARGDGSGSWNVCLARGTSFSCQSWVGPAAVTEDAVSGDFNGDGRTDIAAYPVVDGPADWNVCLSTGSAFSCSSWPGYGVTRNTGDGIIRGYLVGDYNGDGRDDVAMASVNGGEFLCKSIGNGFEGGGCQSYPGSYVFVHYARTGTEGTIESFADGQTAGDFDGDGRTDHLQIIGWRMDPSIYPPATWSGLRATDTGFDSFGAPSTGKMKLQSDPPPGGSLFADHNGDPFGSYSDILSGFSAVNGTEPARAEVCRSDGVQLRACLSLPLNGDYANNMVHVGDFDGDGRSDVYTSGGVCQLRPTGLDAYAYQCSTLPGAFPSTSYIAWFMGDFNGDGRIDRAYYNEATASWAVHLAGHGGFPELLASVRSGAGHETQFDYKGLFDSSVYTPGGPVVYPVRNLRMAGPVVSQMRRANGLGGWLATDYRYEASRTHVTGRGGLGFERVYVTDAAARTTTRTTSSQTYPYIGMPTEVRAHQVDSGVVLHQTSNTLGSFSTTAGAVHPYVSETRVESKDLNGAALPTVTQRINAGGIDAYGNVTDSIETSEIGGESFTTRTENVYEHRVADWLVGLLSRSSVTKTAPAIAPATAAALSFSGCTSTSSVTPARATLTCTLSNTGQSAIASIGYSVVAGATVAGPQDCSANALCGTVTVTTGTTAGSYSGTLTATPNTGAAASVQVSLKVNTPATLTLANCSSTPTTTPTAATMSCVLGNSGETAAASIAYAAPSGTTANGPTSCAAGTGNCGTVTVTTGTAAASYSGTLTATPNAGAAASAAVSLKVSTPAALTLGSCTSTTPTTAPTAATMTCVLGNSGETPVTSISYGAPSGTTASGPASCAASTANCGTVTATTGTAAASYSGTLTATPNAGTVASAAVSLKVRTPAALTLGSCTSTTPTTTPTAATMSCVLGNSGETPVTSISYGAPSGTTASGPASCAASTANCGTVTVTTDTGAASYTGTLTATPNTGAAASAAVSLKVRTPVALTLSSCSSTNPTAPTAATMSCVLGNSGETAASAVSYGVPSGTTANGPTTCAESTTNCGTVTVTTGTVAGSYSGTLSATPNAGAAASASVSLQVRTPAALTLGNCSSTTPTTAPTAATMSCALGNTGQTAASSISYGAPSGTTASGPTTCAADTTNCGTVTVTTGTAAGSYSGTLTATASGGAGASAGVSLAVQSAPALALGSCSSTTPTTSPTAATMSCVLSNAGQSSATVSYGFPAGTSASGPASCPGNTANCGTVTLTTSTSAGAYAGTVTASPSPAGSGASAAFDLRVYSNGTTLSRSPTSLAFGTVSKDAQSSIQTITVTNTGGAPTTLTWPLSYTSGTADRGGYFTSAAGTTCASGGTLSIGASCVIAVQYSSGCTGGSRNGTLNIQGTGATTVSVSLSASTSTSGVCN